MGGVLRLSGQGLDQLGQLQPVNHGLAAVLFGGCQAPGGDPPAHSVITDAQEMGRV